jgi:hypothetical protein
MNTKKINKLLTAFKREHGSYRHIFLETEETIREREKVQKALYYPYEKLKEPFTI